MFRSEFAPLDNTERLPNDISRSSIAIYEEGELERFTYKRRTLSETITQVVILDDTV